MLYNIPMLGCSHCKDAVSNDAHGHFKGKDAIHHIAQVQADGVLASSEIHGAETPGVLFSLMDAARETAVAIVLISLVLSYLQISKDQLFSILLGFCFGWVVWKAGRASWLSWSRLERLHRVMEEERYEIEVNREQERIELKALYEAKGFQGKLLDDVVDVLMADGDRLLRVMLEEELGFRLEENEHPLIQGLGAAIGVIIAATIMLLACLFFHLNGILASSLFVLMLSAFLYARLQRNNVIAAASWNSAIAIFSALVTYLIMPYLL